MDMTRQRFVGLDGLRGIAAVAVVLSHAGHHLKAPWLMGHGALAVDAFFVMSGFVLHRTYGARLRDGWPLRDFARARIGRLYPMCFLGALVGLAVMSAYAWQRGSAEAAPVLLQAFVGASLLLPDLSDPAGQVFLLNAPYWSLLVEAVVSAAYALAAGRVPARSVATLVGVSAAGLAVAVLLGQPLLAGGTAATLWVSLLRGAFGFAMGTAIARAEGLGLLRAVALCPVPCACGLLVALMMVPGETFGPSFDLFGILVASPLVVSVCAAGRVPERASGWCAAGGSLSYPLYTLHAPVLFCVAQVGFPRWDCPPVPAVAVMLAATCACVAAALALGLWVEPRLIAAARIAFASPGGR